MSFSKRERGIFIRDKILLKLLHKAPVRKDGGYKLFDVVFGSKEERGLLDSISTARNVTRKEFAEHPYYVEAVEAWNKYRDERKQAFLDSRSI